VRGGAGWVSDAAHAARGGRVDAARRCARPLAAAAAVLALAACTGEPTPAPAAPGAGHDLPTIEVRIGGAAHERWYDGSVEAVRQATLTAQTTGRVAEALHDVDDRVRAGELLLRLTGVEQRAALRQAEQALREAEARATVADADYARTSDVYAKRLVARAALDRATADRDAAAAQLAAAQAGLASARESAAYTEIRAPYDSVVTRRHVEPGEAVAPGQPLIEVAALERLRVVVDVPSSIAETLRDGGRATVLVGDRRYASDRVVVFPAATAQSSTVRVRIELPEAAVGAYPGLYAKVGFEAAPADAPADARTGGAADAARGPISSPSAHAPISIPSSALVERSEVTAVYVVDADGRLYFRQVRLGRRYGDAVEVLAGLRPGERVASDPVAAAQRLAAARERAP
jgi:RND family efflux transporter MFP subunit